MEVVIGSRHWVSEDDTNARAGRTTSSLLPVLVQQRKKRRDVENGRVLPFSHHASLVVGILSNLHLFFSPYYCNRQTYLRHQFDQPCTRQRFWIPYKAIYLIPQLPTQFLSRTILHCVCAATSVTLSYFPGWNRRFGASVKSTKYRVSSPTLILTNYRVNLRSTTVLMQMFRCSVLAPITPVTGAVSKQYSTTQRLLCVLGCLEKSLKAFPDWANHWIPVYVTLFYDIYEGRGRGWSVFPSRYSAWSWQNKHWSGQEG